MLFVAFACDSSASSASQIAANVWIDDAGLTRDELAERLGIARQHLDRLCRGESRPSLELAVQIESLTRGAIKAADWLQMG